MNRITDQDPSNKTQSKLYIRSEVLAVVQHLHSRQDPSKTEKVKQIKRLRQLERPEYVQDILVNELKRAKQQPLLQILTELLMELGTVEYLYDKLWDIIRDMHITDEVKDSCNLILRHLGDTTDPELYLEYLQDPQGLISQETTRMISASGENPETLIDFIDFILSLNGEDQTRLVSSLHRDYASKELVDMFVPLLESDPNADLWEVLVEALSETRSIKAARSLKWLLEWPEERRQIDPKRIERALKALQLGGAIPENLEDPKTVVIEHGHPILEQSKPFKCFATIPDGIGNQGILFSRQRENSDVSLFCMAINDIHGIIDCFGFYQLGESDFYRIMEKFHEGASKIPVSGEYCVAKLIVAETINRKNYSRLPYEYQCWRPLLGDLKPMDMGKVKQTKEFANADWTPETYNLYQHPDFDSWFLEQGDDTEATEHLQSAIDLVSTGDLDPNGDFKLVIENLDMIATELVRGLLETEWKDLFQLRLAETAYLLRCQDTNTFATLAATEAEKLQNTDNIDDLMGGFTQAYGRRCILEELLRYRTGNDDYEALTKLIDTLAEQWSL